MNRSGRILWIEPDAPAKPALGAPCNGCGVCCLLQPCPVGVVLSRRLSGPCRALRWIAAERRYRCGALLQAQAMADSGSCSRWLRRLPYTLVARWIGADIGCDCDASVESATSL